MHESSPEEITTYEDLGRRLEALRDEYQSSADEIAGFKRLDGLYANLSEAERHYIVARWDDEHGLVPTHKRQNYKNEAPARARRRKLWIIVAGISTLFVLLWISGMMRRDAERAGDSFVLDYLRGHSQNNPALKSAIEAADREYQEYMESQTPEPEE